MKSVEKFSIRKRLKGFKYAFMGLKDAILHEHNIWIHILAAIIALLMGWYFQITRTEWMILCLIIALVIAMEIINTAIEKLCDMICEQRHPIIKRVKDLAASAVLVCSIAAVVIAISLFGHYIF